jgi:hypothetical protein
MPLEATVTSKQATRCDPDRNGNANHVSFSNSLRSPRTGISALFRSLCPPKGTQLGFTLQMIRIIRTRPSFALSRISHRGLCTTAPVSFPEGHGLLPTSQSPITPKPHFFNSVSADGKQLPTYRIIDGVGNVIEGAELPEACPNLCALSSRVLIVMLA